MAQSEGVKTKHPEYARSMDTWRMCRDAAAGEKAVHAGGEMYLPKLRSEKAEDYLARLKRTPFFNATWRTVVGLSGMLFRKPPAVAVPAGVDAYLRDVDMAGSDFAQFAQALSFDALIVGRVGVLVDHPATPDVGRVTISQAERLGLRPAMHIYPAESIINWKTERIGNAIALSMVVLTEEAALPGETEFDHATETRYRVLDLGADGNYRQRLYRINDAGKEEQVGEDAVPLMNGKPMGFIPFVFIGVDSVGPNVELPPLVDLITLNLHHYQVSADYAHGCHISGLPTLFVSGYHPDSTSPPIYLGGSSANCLPDPSAKAYYVETQGNFDALRTNLEDKKAEMAILGSRMLEAQKRQAETVDAIAQHRKGEESLLANMAQTLSAGIQIALEWFTAWAGKAGPVEYDINRDFVPSRMTPQELTAMLAAWQAGMPGYSSEEVFSRLEARDEISKGITFEEEQARISNEAPRLAQNPPPPATAP